MRCNVGSMLTELLKSIFRAHIGGDCGRDFRGVEARVPPGYVGIVDHIRDAPILERTEQVRRDAIRYRCIKNEIFLTQGEKVAPVHPLGYRS